jgi:hypothetical protein
MPEAFQQCLPINAFVLRNSAQNAVQRADAEWGVVRYREALMPGFLGLKNNVAALLMNDTVSPIAA